MTPTLDSIKIKYNLSNEFINEFIQKEIERQALQDLSGILSNMDIKKLRSMMYPVDTDPTDTPELKEVDNGKQSVANTERDTETSKRESKDNVHGKLHHGRNKR